MSPVQINDEFLADHLMEDLRGKFTHPEHTSTMHKLAERLNKWLEKGKMLIASSTAHSPTADARYFQDMISICADIYPLLLELLCKPLDDFDNSSCRVLEIEPSVLDITERSRSLISVLREGQDFAFQMKELRRDNIIHQFRVFLLGYYLITEHGDFLIDFLAWDIEQTPVGPLGSKKKATVLYVWTLTSLFHDCGRGIETYFELQKELAEPKFKNIFETYGLNYPKTRTPTIRGMLEKSPRWKESKKTFFSLLKLVFRRMRGVGSELFRKEIEKPLRDALETKASHAVISAFLLIHPETFKHYEALEKLKATIGGTDSLALDEGVEIRDPLFIQKEHCLADLVPYLMLPFCGAVATAFHDAVDRWFVSPFTQLLTICDNLQEWERLTKVGDQVTKIFPCKQIEIDVRQVKTDSLDARIGIKYESDCSTACGCARSAPGLPCPHPTHLGVLLSRWNPDQKWKDFDSDIGHHLGREIYEKLYRKGLSLRISIMRGEPLLSIEVPKP